jgi:hypothetical protein
LSSTHGNTFTLQKLVSVTSFVLQECGILGVLVRTLGLYYNAETFLFKFLNRIPNSGHLKVTCKTTPSKNSLHNFRTRFLVRKLTKSAKITRVNTVKGV